MPFEAIRSIAFFLFGLLLVGQVQCLVQALDTLLHHLLWAHAMAASGLRVHNNAAQQGNSQC